MSLFVPTRSLFAASDVCAQQAPKLAVCVRKQKLEALLLNAPALCAWSGKSILNIVSKLNHFLTTAISGKQLLKNLTFGPGHEVRSSKNFVHIQSRCLDEWTWRRSTIHAPHQVQHQSLQPHTLTCDTHIELHTRLRSIFKTV